MVKQFDSTVKAVISFLGLLEVRVNDKTVDEILQSHPNWPSLLAISDSLNKWNIPNGAGKIEPSQIDQLPTPFLAYTDDEETPLAIISQITETSVYIFSKKYDKQKAIPKDEFVKKWNGIFLIAESNELSGEPNYKLIKRKYFFNSLLSFSTISAILILSFLFLKKNLITTSNLLSYSVTGVYLQYLIILTGIVLTILLLMYEIDKNNPILQKVCTGIVKGNCSAILTSKQSKLFTWLSWSEVGFIYFSGGLLTLLFTENQFSNTITAIGWVNIAALPYTFFSIYYQWIIAKSWCLLCICVQVLLILGGINVLASNFLSTPINFSTYFIFQVLLLYFLPILIWKIAKPYLLKIQEAKNTKREYLRIKFNTDIFTTLLKKQKIVNIPFEDLGIDLGSNYPKNVIIKVCNPFCDPCSKAHLEIDKLIEQFQDLKVKIIFKIINNENSPSQKIVRHLLALVNNSNNEFTKKILDDWYIPDNKNYEEFSRKHPVNQEILNQNDKIEKMNKWCREMEIRYTPTIFINGYQLPDAYAIEDLKYFLLE